MQPHTLIHDRVEAARSGENPMAIGRVRSGWVVLGDRQFLPGYSLLLADPVVGSLNDLAVPERAQFLLDMAALGDALLRVTETFRINYSIYGNAEAALHAHVFARYRNEPDEYRARPVWSYPRQQRDAVPFDPARDKPLMDAIHRELLAAGVLDIAAPSSAARINPRAFLAGCALADELIELRVIRTLGPESRAARPAAEQFLARATEYRFAIHRLADGLRVGRIHLRFTRDPALVDMVGHAGYAVDEPHRRNGYATRAIRLIVGVARSHAIIPLWIFIEPENIASRRAVERAGFRLVNVVDTQPQAAALGIGPKVCRYLME